MHGDVFLTVMQVFFSRHNELHKSKQKSIVLKSILLTFLRNWSMVLMIDLMIGDGPAWILMESLRFNLVFISGEIWFSFLKRGFHLIKYATICGKGAFNVHCV